MLKKHSTFERLLSLLQGVSWAFVFLGAMTSFLFLYKFSFLIAFIGAFMGSLVGLLFVVLFEIANIQIEKLQELKKQTSLMEQIVKLSSKPTNN